MGSSVVFPSLTNQIVLHVFKILVEEELRKNIHGQFEFRSGGQNGIVLILEALFGTGDDYAAELAYNNGVTWIQIVEEIALDLQKWADDLENMGFSLGTGVNLIELRESVDKAVNNYALKHPKKLGDALRLNF